MRVPRPAERNRSPPLALGRTGTFRQRVHSPRLLHELFPSWLPRALACPTHTPRPRAHLVLHHTTLPRRFRRPSTRPIRGLAPSSGARCPSRSTSRSGQTSASELPETRGEKEARRKRQPLSPDWIG